jgi:hypothetical protein
MPLLLVDVAIYLSCKTYAYLHQDWPSCEPSVLQLKYLSTEVYK